MPTPIYTPEINTIEYIFSKIKRNVYKILSELKINYCMKLIQVVNK